MTGLAGADARSPLTSSITVVPPLIVAWHRAALIVSATLLRIAQA